MSEVNFKRPTELQGAVILFQEIGLDFQDKSGPCARLFYDGQALWFRAADVTQPSAQAELLQAPIGVLAQPRLVLDANVATLAGSQTLQGIALNEGDLVLLTAQTTGSQNWLWVVHTVDTNGNTLNWTRPVLPLYSGQLFMGQAGTYAGVSWRLSNVGALVLGTTAFTFDKLVTDAGGAGADGVTNVNNAASPYTVLTTDQFLLCDSTAGPVNLTLPANYPIGQQLFVIDATAEAGANSITITPPGSQQINSLGLGTAAQITTNDGRKSLIRVSATKWNMV